jgi:hypothetical protein
MKQATVSLVLVLCLPLGAFSQGRFQFNNIYTDPPGTAAVTISTLPGAFNPANGPPGAYVGSNYSASLFWLNGTFENQTDFEGNNPMLYGPADTLFLGTTGTTGIGTGHGPSGDGSGFFDGGIVYLLDATGPRVTVQVRAWYNGGGAYASYEQALAAGQNVGRSNPVGVILNFPPGPAEPLFGLQPFTVGIPEPTTFVLAVLGGAALLVFQPRKSTNRE